MMSIVTALELNHVFVPITSEKFIVVLKLGCQHQNALLLAMYCDISTTKTFLICRIEYRYISANNKQTLRILIIRE